MLLLLLAAAAAAQEPIVVRDLLKEHQSCILDWVFSQPDLKDRFTPVQLAALCRNKERWLAPITGPASLVRSQPQSDPRPLSSDQKAWLSHIADCVPPDCFRTTTTAAPKRTRRQEWRPTTVARKEYRVLSDAERARFHSALQRLKADKVDGMSKYDLFLHLHTPLQAPGAHWGPGFLPWHRELLRQFEVALRQYDPELGLPYWDSTLDSALPNPAESVLWSSDFLGNSTERTGYVLDGPFANWTTQQVKLGEPRIVRSLGKHGLGSLYEPQDIDKLLGKRRYEQLTSCVDPYFELTHGSVHLWVGGHMADIPVSPDDPAFFLHHAFVDYLWEQWRQNAQTATQRENDYPGQQNSCSAYHLSNRTMLPFTLHNKDGMANHYTFLFYHYQPRPTCSRGKPSCGSPYLFCDVDLGRCLSKLKAGADCSGFERSDICLRSLCRQGRCKKEQTEPAEKLKLPELPTRAPTRPTTTTTTTTTPTPTTTSPLTPSTTFPTLPPLPKKRTAAGQLSVNDSRECLCPKLLPIAVKEVRIRHILGEVSAKKARDEEWVRDEPTPSVKSWVWFAVTVLRGAARDPIKDLPLRPRIKTIGLDYFGESRGSMSEATGQYPAFPGAALVRVADPKHNFGTATAALNVTQGDRPCLPYCYQDDATGYGECDGIVHIDERREKSDPVAFTPAKTQALYLAWHLRQRKPTYLLFLCPSDGKLSDDPQTTTTTAPPSTAGGTSFFTAIHTQPTTPLPATDSGKDILTGTLTDLITDSGTWRRGRCAFLRFPRYVLMGYAEEVLSGVSLRTCKSRCLLSEHFPCASVMFWDREGDCILNSESRRSQPELFLYSPKEEMLYFDLVCDLADVIES